MRATGGGAPWTGGQAFGSLVAGAYEALARRSAGAAGVSPALVGAVMQVESGFDPRATSAAGAAGLMQLMPAAAESLGVADPYDPAQNVRGVRRISTGFSNDFTVPCRWLPRHITRDPAPSSATAAFRRMPKRERMWTASWLHIARAAVCSVACLSGAGDFLSSVASARADVPDIRVVLNRYQRAIADPGVAEIAHQQSVGTIAGAGLAGAFRTWLERDRERTEQNLGPRSERTLRIGDRIWYADADGDVREFTGILARRLRTERFIDSGEFAKAPERCISRGATIVAGHAADAIDVTAPAGETETLYLDAVSGLPMRLAYDDDDGRTTIDFSDWRDVGGHRFPFRSVVSNGDRAYDTTQVTTAVDIAAPVDATIFAPLVSRRIDMSAPESLALETYEGHLYAPVRIGTHRYQFLIDTGAQNILIDKRVARELGLHASGSLEASGAARTGGLQLAKVDDIEIGHGHLRDIVATTIDLGASTAGAFRIDGILGYPFFASATVRLDPAKKTMTFGPPGSFAPTGERIAVELDRAFPEARVRLNAAIEAPFIVDTGNAAEVLLYKPFVDRHPGIVPFTLTSRHSYGIGGATVSYRSTLDQIEFGGVPIYHAETDVMQATKGAFADRFDAGNVGLGLLKNFTITFDLANSAMYLERGESFDDGRTRT